MSNVQQMLDELRCGRSGCDCLRALPGKGHVHCPAHEDAKPSFSVSERDGNTLFHCQAGCTQDQALGALQEKGLWTKPTTQVPSKKRSDQETRYQVRDIDGQTIAVHVRKDGPKGKRMPWEQPDGTSGLKGLPVSALPLYGSEDLAALPDGELVVVTEGESSRDALKAEGIAAFGTVTGAGETPGNDALKPLVRLKPILWPDNDEPGYPHMNRIAARLAALGCSTVGIVDWPEAPHKGDAADAVKLGVDVSSLIGSAQTWKPGNIALASVLDEVTTFLRSYVVLSEHQQRALALWIAHTHAIDAADCTPYISINSAEKQSGKTRLLEVLDLLVARPWFTSRATSSVLVRKIADEGPTLLLDETDATFNGDKEYSETLRGVLNAGYKRTGVYSMSVPANGDWECRDLSVFGAKALAGIGQLPDTVRDRSIPIELRRKSKSEIAHRFRRRDAALDAAPLADALGRWSDEAIPILEPARPDIPEELGDRAADVWEPLLAIADMAGGEWPTWARQAASELSSKAAQEDDSTGSTLLRDIYNIFIARKVDRLFSTDLASELANVEESSWGDIRGKPLNASGLARRLKPFGIKPKQIRIEGTSLKGYMQYDFIDAWERYTPEIGETPETPKQIIDFVPSNASGNVSPNDDSSETGFSGETKNRAYVSAVSLVSVSEGIGATGKDDSEDF